MLYLYIYIIRNIIISFSVIQVQIIKLKQLMIKNIIVNRKTIGRFDKRNLPALIMDL